jgi:hypothetical protein
MGELRVLLGYAVDLIGPLAIWGLTRWLGISMLWGLSLSLGFTVLSAAVNTFRQRKMDAVGALVLLEIIVSIALVFWLHSPRMILIRASFYSAIAAFYLMANAFTAQPLSLEGSKPMATKGDALRTAAWERAWQQLPQFRLAHRLLTFGTGVAALTDAALRVLVVYRFPLDRAAWLANVPHITAWVVLIVIWAIFGRWAGPLIDNIQQQLAAGSLTSQPASH